MADEKELTLKEKLDAVTFRNEQAAKVSAMVKENEKLKQTIAESKKSTRGPSSAGRISGLQTLKNTLGSQFKKETTV